MAEHSVTSSESSSNESFCSETDEEMGGSVGLGMGLAPYQMEPRREEGNESDAPDLGHFFDREIRIGNRAWCDCGECRVETTVEAAFCCHESPELSRVKSSDPAAVHQCITQHPGFASNCLDPWVLQAVYNHYRTQYGRLRGSQEQRYRYTAYRNLVYWAWGRLGRHNRVPLPSCVLNKIRERFPESGEHVVLAFRDKTGFAGNPLQASLQPAACTVLCIHIPDGARLGGCSTSRFRVCLD